MNHDIGTAIANLKKGCVISRLAWNSRYWLVHKNGKTFIGNEYGMLELFAFDPDDILAEDWIINAWQPDADAVEEAPIKVNLLGMPRFGVSDDGAMS